jgi:hypothetical protein
VEKEITKVLITQKGINVDNSYQKNEEVPDENTYKIIETF